MLAGALAVPSAFSVLAGGEAGASPARRRTKARVGVILPNSTVYPALAENLISGLTLGFDEARSGGGPDLRVVRKYASPGERAASHAADEILAAGADLAVGFVPPGIAASLDHRFGRSDRVFVALDAGADVPRPGDDEHAFRHSLSMWRAERAFGGWAAEKLGRRAALVTSFHDSGYDAPYAFRVGFEAAGGQADLARVTHVSGTNDGLGDLVGDISAARPDFVYAAYCGSQAEDFARAYADAGLSGRVPFLGSGFMTGGIPPRLSSRVAVRTCSSWAAGIGNKVDRRFVSAYRKKTGREPDEISVLGYETALMISAALAAAGNDPRRNRRFGAALTKAGVSGPRGPVKMNADGVSDPSRNLYIKAAGHGVRMGTDAVPESQIAALRDGVKTGWLDTYLGM